MIAPIVLMLLLSGSQGWGVQRNQSGVRIGQRQTSYLGGNNVRGSGVKIGVKDKGFTRVVTTTPPPPPTLPPPPDPTAKKMVKVGLLVPKRQFGSRDYQKSVNSALMSIQRATRGRQLSSFKNFDFQHITVMNPYTPSPTGTQLIFDPFPIITELGWEETYEAGTRYQAHRSDFDEEADLMLFDSSYPCTSRT